MTRFSQDDQKADRGHVIAIISIIVMFTVISLVTSISENDVSKIAPTSMPPATELDTLKTVQP